VIELLYAELKTLKAHMGTTKDFIECRSSVRPWIIAEPTMDISSKEALYKRSLTRWSNCEAEVDAYLKIIESRWDTDYKGDTTACGALIENIKGINACMKSSVNDNNDNKNTNYTEEEDSGNNKTQKIKEKIDNATWKALDSLAKVSVDDFISDINMLDVDTANAVHCVTRLEMFFIRMGLINVEGEVDGDLPLNRLIGKEPLVSETDAAKKKMALLEYGGTKYADKKQIERIIAEVQDTDMRKMPLVGHSESEPSMESSTTTYNKEQQFFVDLRLNFHKATPTIRTKY
jgi:hypothetical protein